MSSVRFTGPTCQGSATMYVLPLDYKREGTHTVDLSLEEGQLRIETRHLYSQAIQPTVDVGYYARAVRTTLTLVFSCSSS
jgi:hypothetical protein